MLSEYAVATPCGKIFMVLKTTQGFSDKKNGGYYVSPLITLDDGDAEIAVRDTKDSVVSYLENKGWLDYKKMRISKIISSLIVNAKLCIP